MKKRHLIFCFLLVYLISGRVDLSSASQPDLKPFVFPQVTGWRRSGEIQTFIPKTLFEYINGGADLYLSYDFQELKVAEYSNAKKSSVIIEIYRHKTPIHAFGIYSQERLSDANFLEIGAQGYIETNVLNFVGGPYYVKINSFNTGADDRKILIAFAKKVSEILGERGALPSILSSFPEEGKKKNSEKFINRNFLGYSFLHSAFSADYSHSEIEFKLFVIESAEKSDCKEMIEKYLQQTRSPGQNISEGRYNILDPYHGEIDLCWKGNYIWGIFNAKDRALRSKYLRLLEEGIEKNRQKK